MNGVFAKSRTRRAQIYGGVSTIEEHSKEGTVAIVHLEI